MFPPTKAVFSGIDILLSVSISVVISTPISAHIQNYQTAKGVGASYDALVDIFECVDHFLRRLSIYNEIPPTPVMTEMVIKIMAELITVLALATKQMKQGRFSMSSLVFSCKRSLKTYIVAEKYAKKILGEKDIESVLDRLNRLTLEESKMTATQTLEVVCRLVNNMQVLMEGAHHQYIDTCVALYTFMVDGKASTDDIRQTLGASG